MRRRARPRAKRESARVRADARIEAGLELAAEAEAVGPFDPMSPLKAKTEALLPLCLAWTPTARRRAVECW